jgi:hypothetical protein
MLARVWRYHMVIAYYYRNGYWLGMLRGLVRRSAHSKWAWVGFAPNPPISGLRGNARPVIEMLQRRTRRSRTGWRLPLGRRNGRKLLILMLDGTGSVPVTPDL